MLKTRPTNLTSTTISGGLKTSPIQHKKADQAKLFTESLLLLRRTMKGYQLGASSLKIDADGAKKLPLVLLIYRNNIQFGFYLPVCTQKSAAATLQR